MCVSFAESSGRSSTTCWSASGRPSVCRCGRCARGASVASSARPAAKPPAPPHPPLPSRLRISPTRRAAMRATRRRSSTTRRRRTPPPPRRLRRRRVRLAGVRTFAFNARRERVVRSLQLRTTAAHSPKGLGRNVDSRRHFDFYTINCILNRILTFSYVFFCTQVFALL